MDTNGLIAQVSTIIGQLNGLFDEIGVPDHERESRELDVGASPDSVGFNDGANRICSFSTPCHRLYIINYA